MSTVITPSPAFTTRMASTFDALVAWGGPSDHEDDGKAEDHRRLEEPVRHFMRYWFDAAREEEKQFWPFDDPRPVSKDQLIITPPMDAVSDDWDLGVEFKHSGKLPIERQRETGGWWLPDSNYQHMLKFCGIRQKNERPLRRGWFVYYFDCGSVYALSIHKLDYLIRRKCRHHQWCVDEYDANKDVYLDPRKQFYHKRWKHAYLWVIPMPMWTYLGNMYHGNYVEAKDYVVGFSELVGRI